MTRSLDNILTSLLIFVVGMTLAQFVVGIKLSTVGGNLTSLEKEWVSLTQENQKLREEIALRTSITSVASKATEFGLQEPTEVMYMTLVQDQANLPSQNKP